MKLLIVVNPISGGVNKDAFLAKAKAMMEFYNIDFEIFKTTGTKDEEKLAETLNTYQPDRVASVGGDGTSLFTGIALKGKNIPMGIVPLGSANGLAVELGVNSKPLEALKDILISQHIKGLDMILVNDEHHCMHIGDVGVNANLVEKYDRDPNRGMLTYAKYFIEELKDFNHFNLRVNINGEEVKNTVFMAAFCNARRFGTGVPLNNVSNPMDGKFEITLLNRLSTSVLIKAGLAKFSESFIDLDDVTILEGTEADVFFEEPQLLQLDGEVIGNFMHINLKVLESAVPFITHGGNPYA